jgi:hypothetical protein
MSAESAESLRFHDACNSRTLPSLSCSRFPSLSGAPVRGSCAEVFPLIFSPRRPRSRLRRGIFGPAAQSQSLAFPLTGLQHRRISALTSGLELRPELPADEYQKIPGGPPGARTPIYVPHVTLYFQCGANRSFNTGVRAVPARQA